MRRTFLHLGRTPVMRRVLAAAILLGGAVVVTLMRGAGEQVWFDLAINLGAATVALGILHLRWKRREGPHITPAKARDIFS